MAHYIDNQSDIFDINSVVPNEENKSSKELPRITQIDQALKVMTVAQLVLRLV